MRIVLGVLLALWAGGASAAPVHVEKLVLSDAGTYRSAPGSCGKSSSGVTVCGPAQSVALVSSTRTVQAKLGTTFGARFKAYGTPANATKSLRVVVHFPAPGLKATSGGSPVRQVTTSAPFLLGNPGGGGVLYGFQEAFELVPGTWTFDVYDGGRKLTSVSFKVVK